MWQTRYAAKRGEDPKVLWDAGKRQGSARDARPYLDDLRLTATCQPL